jgi:hypothetical protein
VSASFKDANKLEKGDFTPALHRRNGSNYLPVDLIEEDEWLELYRVRLFTKLSIKIPIGPMEIMEQQLMAAYAHISEILR